MKFEEVEEYIMKKLDIKDVVDNFNSEDILKNLEFDAIIEYVRERVDLK